MKFFKVLTLEESRKPYPNEHACRLNEPDKYGEMRRVNGAFESNGKKIDAIYGIIGKGNNKRTEIQAYRYPKTEWTRQQAQDHCKKHNGIKFEVAAAK